MLLFAAGVQAHAWIRAGCQSLSLQFNELQYEVSEGSESAGTTGAELWES